MKKSAFDWRKSESKSRSERMLDNFPMLGAQKKFGPFHKSEVEEKCP